MRVQTYLVTPGVICYLAFGFVFLVMFGSDVGGRIDLQNGWTYVWVLAWPVVIFLWFAKWILFCLVMGFVIWLIVLMTEYIRDQRRARHRKP